MFSGKQGKTGEGRSIACCLETNNNHAVWLFLSVLYLLLVAASFKMDGQTALHKCYTNLCVLIIFYQTSQISLD